MIPTINKFFSYYEQTKTHISNCAEAIYNATSNLDRVERFTYGAAVGFAGCAAIAYNTTRSAETALNLLTGSIVCGGIGARHSWVKNGEGSTTKVSLASVGLFILSYAFLKTEQLKHTEKTTQIKK